MQNVKVSQNLLNSLEFNTLLTLEQAEWYTQNEGFIPLPRKTDRKNIYVIFTNRLSDIFITLVKKKIKKYRISEFIVGDEYTENYIIVLELENAMLNKHYIFDPFLEANKIIKTQLNSEGLKSIFKKYGPNSYFTFIKH